ncbi:MAG: transposase domain-containing protein, partial [Lachnospiraceae bacterium]|nr:transposase domain-containing protein [Lachnospiraceae bacterium]
MVQNHIFQQISIFSFFQEIVIIYSVIQTALLNNLKPENYLEYVFGQIQINRDTDLNDLMPWSEKIPE